VLKGNTIWGPTEQVGPNGEACKCEGIDSLQKGLCPSKYFDKLSPSPTQGQLSNKGENKCNPKDCAEWTCKDWCQCFKAEPKIVEIFEGPNPSQWDLDVRNLCPSDGQDECDCTEFFFGNAKKKVASPGGVNRCKSNQDCRASGQVCYEVTKDYYFGDSDRCNEYAGGCHCRFPKKPERVCCKAMTANCMACAAGLTEKEYCEINADALGCAEVSANPVKRLPAKEERLNQCVPLSDWESKKYEVICGGFDEELCGADSKTTGIEYTPRCKWERATKPSGAAKVNAPGQCYCGAPEMTCPHAGPTTCSTDADCTDTMCGGGVGCYIGSDAQVADHFFWAEPCAVENLLKKQKVPAEKLPAKKVPAQKVNVKIPQKFEEFLKIDEADEQLKLGESLDAAKEAAYKAAFAKHDDATQVATDKKKASTSKLIPEKTMTQTSLKKSLDAMLHRKDSSLIPIDEFVRDSEELDAYQTRIGNTNEEQKKAFKAAYADKKVSNENVEMYKTKAEYVRSYDTKQATLSAIKDSVKDSSPIDDLDLEKRHHAIKLEPSRTQVPTDKKKATAINDGFTEQFRPEVFDKAIKLDPKPDLREKALEKAKATLKA